MSIDTAWLDTLRAMPDLATRDTLLIDGVEIDLPISNARGRDRFRDWQRRILPDLMPDSVNADAPERTPFRLLYALTTSQNTEHSIEEVMTGEMQHLEELFRAETRGKKIMTLAFHVLAVKAAGAAEREAKGYTERTLMLLFRKENGEIDAELIRELVEKFRLAPSDLDLAQRTILNKIHDGWTPDHEPKFKLPDDALLTEVPFDPSAARLFRQDVATLVGANLPPADFFHQLNLLLTIHLGLYQPRVAVLLNPQMDALFEEMARPDPRNLRDLDTLLQSFASRHPFDGLLHCRAPDPDLRPVNLHTPSRESFEKLANILAVFHFNILLFVQLRRLGEVYFAHRLDQLVARRSTALPADAEHALALRVRTPRDFLHHMAEDKDYAAFLRKALTALAVRFIYHQIAESDRDVAFDEMRMASSALHAFRRLYERYNIQTSPNKSNSRANRQGIAITSGLLRQGQYGLVQGRQRVGPFFEVGAGLLPLLLLLAVGPSGEKVPVNTFWARLSSYGLSFDSDERQRLLVRLRSMGVYERYSDAGEAAYVRNLMMTMRAA